MSLQVDILNYPSIPAGNMLDQFVEVGTDVVFECNPSYVAIDRHFFYVNGEIVRQGVDGAPGKHCCFSFYLGQSSDSKFFAFWSNGKKSWGRCLNYFMPGLMKTITFLH